MLSPRICAFLLACLVPLRLLAVDAPPHPTLLLAEYRGRHYPVVAVEKQAPIILIEGQRKKLSARAALRTNRVADFAATRAEAVYGGLHHLLLVNASSDIEAEKVLHHPGAVAGGYLQFQATLTAGSDLKDCYLAFVAFRADFLTGGSDQPEAQIRLRQIPDLPARRPIEVKFSSDPFLGDVTKLRLFVLLFSGAEEIHGGGNAVAWSYFLRREQVLHHAALTAWLERHRGADRAPEAILPIPPLFLTPVSLPADVVAEVELDPHGDVTAVNLPDGLPVAAVEPLRRTLHAWRFTPKLVRGTPVPARVRVPLRF